MNVYLGFRAGIGVMGCLLVLFVYASGAGAGTGQTGATLPGKKPVARVYSGPIEGFTLEKVYINGIGHKLSRDISFYSRQGEVIPKRALRRGCRVKFVKNRKHEVVVMQME